MEREEPSEQPCREGETTPGFGNPTQTPISVVTTLVTSNFQMLVQVLSPMLLDAAFQTAFSMVLDVVESEEDITMDLQVTTNASMTATSSACIASAVETDLIVPDFTTWVHSDPDFWYPVGLLSGLLVGDRPSGDRFIGVLVPISTPRIVRALAVVINDPVVGGRGRLAVYGVTSTTDFYPLNLVFDAAVTNGGDIDTGSNGLKSLTVGITLNPGVYWFGTIFNSGTRPGMLCPQSPINTTNILLGSKPAATHFLPTSVIHCTTLTYPLTGTTPLTTPFPASGVTELSTSGVDQAGMLVSWGS